MSRARGSSLSAFRTILLRNKSIDAEHTEYERGHFFVDKMNRGPFAVWVHRHIIEADGPNASKLIDQVDSELPFGSLGKLFGAGFAR